MRGIVKHHDEIESGLAAISDVLANASTCFDVYYELQNGSKRDTYEPIVDAYPIFFETTVIAHLVAMSTLIYSVLETRNDSHSIPGLLRVGRRCGKDAAALSAIEAKVESLRPTWVKVSRIRNEVFGHRSKGRSPAQVFAEIDLLPEQIGRLIQELKDLDSEIAGIFGTVVSAVLSISATEETTALMCALAEKHAP
jgi:hypothetical protein